MRTSEQIYHQVRWDPRFDPARFVLGVQQRGRDPKRVPLPAFTPGGDVPWHRVLFVEADGELVWDRATSVDRIDSSGAGRVRERRVLPPFFDVRAPHAWSPERGWAATVAAGAEPGLVRLRVLTWNTLWDRYDADRIDTARRRPLLLDGLARADADVIALQEVEPELLGLLLATPWVRERYTVGGDATGTDDGGLLLLSRLPVREAGWRLLGPHKAAVAVTVDTAAGPLAVVATHLSSDRSGQGPARRLAELTVLAEGLAGIEADLLVLGDFNDGGDTAATMLGLGDAWTQAHGAADATPTFDPVDNPLAAVSSLSGLARRLDRVLLRGGLRTGGATLVGDRPQPDGLFPSDHYGVLVALSAGGDDTDVLDAAPTARTALAWVPPEPLWPAIQELRRAHDPQARRWPPHVNILFGFVPESAFEQAAPLLAEAAAEVAPFSARLHGVHTFGHRDDATIWLDPAADGDQPWQRLAEAMRRRFPRCAGRAEGFTPHLTLGRGGDPQRVAAACAARLPQLRATVDELVLLSRRGGEPMRPRAVLSLATGTLTWLPEEPGVRLPSDRPSSVPRSDQASSAPMAVDQRAVGLSGDPRPGLAVDSDSGSAGSVARRLGAAFAGGEVHVVGSRRTDCAVPGADLDLVAVLPGEPSSAEVTARVVGALPEAVDVREVGDARVPRLRLTVGELGVDLVAVGSGRIEPGAAVARRAELGEAAAVALSAVSDADAVLDAVGPHREQFRRLARQVKGWAAVRGLDAAPFGGLPGLAWSVLAARTVRDLRGAEHPDVLLRFFEDWAGWGWRVPVVLGGVPSGTFPPGTILTPTAPVRSCAEQLGPGMLDLLAQELYEAWELASTAADPWPALTRPPPLHRRHASWLVVTAHGGPDGLGRVHGKMRALLTALAGAGVAQPHAWPRPFTTAPATRYAIGLGPTPPDSDAVTAAARCWAATLPGVQTALTDNGTVPTLL